ncbi:putative ankyrin repeat domain-containing protein 27 [Apostichopus japonicus]|uniref:Putative ankyrin repeat domain-containing protein 27 n=1 Tax=Stichopus japonicus TaxID=307972 RepID=A0A2G8KMD9_STIJA|nr:putative ankyrin repeat domain-containing protein 27 [Apostichopus japonicus]
MRQLLCEFHETEGPRDRISANRWSARPMVARPMVYGGTSIAPPDLNFSLVDFPLPLTSEEICVPRTGVFVRHSLTQKDFENHILQADEEHAGVFTTLNGKELQITADGLTTRKGFDTERIVHVLFEETFYNDSDDSFKVACIDRLLEGGTDIVEDPVQTCLETVDDCTEFLLGHKHSKASQQQVDDKIQAFLDSHEQFQSTRTIIDANSDLFTRTMQIALKDSVLRKLVRQNKSHMENLKVAMETYVMNEVSSKVLKQLIQLMASEDSKLNKTTRNLSDLQVRDLQVRQEFAVNLPRARRELSILNQYSTPLEKLHCLRKAVATITQPGYRDKLQLGGTGPAMSSDDLLPLLIFLVVKSEIPNWLANLTYMQQFRFANFGHGEFGFYLASFEAAIEHVRSGSLSALPLGVLMDLA